MKVAIKPRPIIMPCPVLVVGTYNEDGTPNIMTAAWGGVACSRPPCVTISLREATHSFGNIKRSGAFTVNIPSEKHVKQADYAGIVSGRDHNKFLDTALTHKKSEFVNAPIVMEFPYALECKLIKQIELGLHTMFIGEIMGIVADEGVIGNQNLPDIEKVRPILFGSSGSKFYYKVGNKLGDAYSIGKLTSLDE
ncbi:MAG: flavin reductase family protein [Bacteroidales bacterium]